MTAAKSICMPERLESAVRALCVIIKNKLSERTSTAWCEYRLRRELVACIVGSQVRYEIAVSVVDRMEKAGLLDNSWWNKPKRGFERQVFLLLSARSSHHKGNGRYRFPKVRARQLSKARDTLARQPLSDRLFDTSDPKRLRYRFVTDIPGIGPKQASMFLRNIGVSYELSILDTHVLRFMNIQKRLTYYNNQNISSLSSYERVERIVDNYARSLGYPVGYLDWAIWATMRAARELGL